MSTQDFCYFIPIFPVDSLHSNLKIRDIKFLNLLQTNLAKMAPKRSVRRNISSKTVPNRTPLPPDTRKRPFMEESENDEDKEEEVDDPFLVSTAQELGVQSNNQLTSNSSSTSNLALNMQDIPMTPLHSSSITSQRSSSSDANPNPTSIHLDEVLELNDLVFGKKNFVLFNLFNCFIFSLSGRKSFERLKNFGFCIPHFEQMKLPKLITVKVSNSLEIERGQLHNLSTHFEILVRKLLNIFARDPLTVSAVHNVLIKEVTSYGSAAFGLEHERLLTPTLVQAMMKNSFVIL